MRYFVSSHKPLVLLTCLALLALGGSIALTAQSEPEVKPADDNAPRPPGAPLFRTLDEPIETPQAGSPRASRGSAGRRCALATS